MTEDENELHRRIQETKNYDKIQKDYIRTCREDLRELKLIPIAAARELSDNTYLLLKKNGFNKIQDILNFSAEQLAEVCSSVPGATEEVRQLLNNIRKDPIKWIQAANLYSKSMVRIM